MKANGFYKDMLKRLSTIHMKDREREIAQIEVRRALSVIELIMGVRRTSTGVRA